MNVLIGFIFCLICSVISTEDLNGRGECKPLPECEALLFLVQHKDEIPGMSRADVFKTLRDAMCGYEGKTPKVIFSYFTLIELYYLNLFKTGVL